MQVWNRRRNSSFQVEWELYPIQWRLSVGANQGGTADWNNCLWISQVEIKELFQINRIAGAKSFGVQALLVLQIFMFSSNNQLFPSSKLQSI